MNDSLLFSIITPVYNRVDCIKRCIESVNTQTFDSYEFIVINDGSTDDTLKIIDSFKDFINLKVISYAENKGVNYARNRGIEKAEGKFIIFLDSDDWLPEDALKQIHHAVLEHPGFLHYLFGVSDRINDKSLPKTVKEFQYRDWLSGKVSGDFAHVIDKTCFKCLLFVEQFRTHEFLNWFRVLRRNKKQIYIPVLIFNRERDRTDSVTGEATLNNKKSMQSKYDSMYIFIEWYKDDFINFNMLKLLQLHIKITIVLGLALGERNRNEYLIGLLNKSIFSKFLFKILNNLPIQSLVFRLIKTKSHYNKLVKNENRSSYI